MAHSDPCVRVRAVSRRRTRVKAEREQHEDRAELELAVGWLRRLVEESRDETVDDDAEGCRKILEHRRGVLEQP